MLDIGHLIAIGIGNCIPANHVAAVRSGIHFFSHSAQRNRNFLDYCINRRCVQRSQLQLFAGSLPASCTGLRCGQRSCLPVVPQCLSISNTANGAGFRFRTGGIFPLVPCGFSLRCTADGTGLGFRAGGILPLVLCHFALGCTANGTGLGLLARRLDPLVSSRLFQNFAASPAHGIFGAGHL